MLRIFVARFARVVIPGFLVARTIMSSSAAVVATTTTVSALVVSTIFVGGVVRRMWLDLNCRYRRGRLEMKHLSSVKQMLGLVY